MTIITNDDGDIGGNAEQQTNVNGQQGERVLSPLAVQVLVTGGHHVPETETETEPEPDLTVREILRVLAAARA